MKILYITMESLDVDPILLSQVIPLLTKLRSTRAIENITLITYEKTIVDYDFTFNHRPLKKSNKLFDQLRLLHFLFKNKKSYDVLHIRSYLPMFIALLAKFTLNKKVIFDPRGLYADEIKYGIDENRSFNKKMIFANFIKYIERYLYSKSDLTILVSHAFKKYITAKYNICNSKCLVIPTFSIPKPVDLSVNYSDFRKNKSWDDKVILCYSGSLEKWQQFDEVLSFCIKARENNNKFRFCFFSKNIELMKAKVKNHLPLSECHFASLTPLQLNRAMAICDYGLLFRSSNIINQVSAPIKFKDYLCSGLEVLVTDNIGDCSEIIKRTGYGKVIINTFENLDQTFDQMRTISDDRKNEIVSFISVEYSLDVCYEQYEKAYKVM